MIPNFSRRESRLKWGRPAVPLPSLALFVIFTPEQESDALGKVNQLSANRRRPAWESRPLRPALIQSIGITLRPTLHARNLRSAIVTIMEKNVSDETKRGLLRKDVAEFDKKCSEFDPDSQAIFQAALQPERRPQRLIPGAQQPLRSPQIATSSAPGSTAGVSVAGAPQALPSPVANFGFSPSGERRGWVSLMRREPGKDNPESQFDGYSITDVALPAVGAMLTARRMLPVWIRTLRAKNKRTWRSARAANRGRLRPRFGNASRPRPEMGRSCSHELPLRLHGVLIDFSCPSYSVKLLPRMMSAVGH